MKRVLLVLLPFLAASTPVFAACHPSVFCGGAGYCFCEAEPVAPAKTIKQKPSRSEAPSSGHETGKSFAPGSVPQGHAQAPAAAPVSQGEATPAPQAPTAPAAPGASPAAPAPKPVTPGASHPFNPGSKPTGGAGLPKKAMPNLPSGGFAPRASFNDAPLNQGEDNAGLQD